jgi:hypothetical protein
MEELKHNIEVAFANIDQVTLQMFAQNTRKGGCLTLTRWCAFTAFAVKLFCRFFLTKKK